MEINIYIKGNFICSYTTNTTFPKINEIINFNDEEFVVRKVVHVIADVDVPGWANKKRKLKEVNCYAE